MISTSWSTPLSPGKIGWNNNSVRIIFGRKCCDEVPTSTDFDHCINSHQPGPTSAQQKRNQHSTHRCSLCSQSLQKSVQVPWRNSTVSCVCRRISRKPVVSRADVWDIGFASNQMLGAAKIAQLQDSRLGIKQKILEEESFSWFSALKSNHCYLGLDVPVADAVWVDVRKRPEG